MNAKQSTEQILISRKSIRAFLPDKIARTRIENILTLARKAPSGANLQPGKFHVLTGTALDSLKNTLNAAIVSKRPIVTEYSYFPEKMPANLKAKQRAAGYALYSALGIERRDIKGRVNQFNHNYNFFDAPVGIVVTIHKDMGKGCFMDLGMALMALFSAAEADNLATSGIGAIANYGDLLHETLSLPTDELVVCGIALGKPDKIHPVNLVRTDRDKLEDFTRFYGFED